VNAYAVAGWENFLVAEVTAAAALAGLIFVAVSINLSRIIALPGVSGRAADALGLLFALLAAALFGLVPGQPSSCFASELLAFGSVTVVVLLVLELRDSRHAHLRRVWIFARVGASQLGPLLMVIAGATMLAHRGGGLYWMPVGAIASLGGAMLHAWILLVEIQR
jgi:modulator of FtsH protease